MSLSINHFGLSPAELQSVVEHPEDDRLMAATIIDRMNPFAQEALLKLAVVDALEHYRRRHVSAAERRALHGPRVQRPAPKPGGDPFIDLAENLRGILSDYRTGVRLELTSELLAASFALGQGRSVTWGEATVTDHQERVALLSENITGNMRTVQVHQAAIALLATKHATCLNDVA